MPTVAPISRKTAVGRPRKTQAEKSYREVVVTLKGTPAWKKWAREFATSERLPLAILIDHALNAYAKQKEFESPPER